MRSSRKVPRRLLLQQTSLQMCAFCRFFFFCHLGSRKSEEEEEEKRNFFFSLLRSPLRLLRNRCVATAAALTTQVTVLMHCGLLPSRCPLQGYAQNLWSTQDKSSKEPQNTFLFFFGKVVLQKNLQLSSRCKKMGFFLILSKGGWRTD